MKLVFVKLKLSEKNEWLLCNHRKSHKITFVSKCLYESASMYGKTIIIGNLNCKTNKLSKTKVFRTYNVWYILNKPNKFKKYYILQSAINNLKNVSFAFKEKIKKP